MGRSMPSPPNSDQRGSSEPDDAPMYELIELFYFAYRDFVNEPDDALATLGKPASQ